MRALTEQTSWAVAAQTTSVRFTVLMSKFAFGNEHIALLKKNNLRSCDSPPALLSAHLYLATEHRANASQTGKDRRQI